MVLSFRKILVKISIQQSDFPISRNSASEKICENKTLVKIFEFTVYPYTAKTPFNPCSAEMDRSSLENGVDLDQLASDEPI